MTELERRKVVQAVTLLMRVFRVELDELDWGVWLEDLEGLPADAIEQACGMLRKAATSDDFPTRPGDVREMAEDIVKFKAEKARSKQPLLAGPEEKRSEARMMGLFDRGSAKFLARHPQPHLHYRGNCNLGAGDVDWTEYFPGCCAPIEQRDLKPANVTPIAAGPKPVPPAVPKGGGGDWLTKHQEEQEERDRRW